jgi:peptide/nickel transport system substrate-binding protein
LDSDQILNLKKEAPAKNWQVVEEAGGTVSYMVLNVKQKPLDQVEVRQAIASLIDRPLITERVYKKQAEPTYSIVPTSFDTHKPTFQEPYGDGNVDKVKELLTKAGFSKDKPFELELITPLLPQSANRLSLPSKNMPSRNWKGLCKLNRKEWRQPLSSPTLPRVFIPVIW